MHESAAAPDPQGQGFAFHQRLDARARPRPFELDVVSGVPGVPPFEADTPSLIAVLQVLIGALFEERRGAIVNSRQTVPLVR
jgi:hypothetical protein